MIVIQDYYTEIEKDTGEIIGLYVREFVK